MLTTDDVQKLILTAIPGAQVQVTDLTGTSDHFGIRVVAEAFVGKTSMERHRMVHAALGRYLTREIHAIDLKTFAPDQV